MEAQNLVLVFGIVLVAGCFDQDARQDTSDPAVPEDWFLRATPTTGSVQGHDHGDPFHHADLTTPNFHVLGWNPLVTEYHGVSSGTWYCGEVAETEERSLAVYNSFTSDVAIAIVDVKDPTAPELVGELALPFTHVYDAAVSDDGRFAILATSPLDTGPDAAMTFAAAGGMATPARTLQPEWKDACGNTFKGPEDTVPYASGVVLVDMTDPTAPAVADYRPLPALGAHSVSETTIDGTSYVVASTTNLAQQVSYFNFYTINELPAAGGRLVEYGVFSAQYPSQQSPIALVNGHVDGTIQKHPVTGQLLAYLANWDGGMAVVELAAPGLVVPVSVWGGFGAVHTTLPLSELWGERHITVIGQEAARVPGGSTGWVALLDTTDPADPVAVAWWTLPFGELEWDTGLMFSTHYVEVVDRMLFVSLYHGGVWAADASPEHWPALPTTGVFVPTPLGEMEAPATGALAPQVLDVNALADGTLLVFDSYSGAFALRYEPDARVPAAAPLDVAPDWIG